MSTCYATKHSAPTHKAIIHDRSDRGLQEPSEVINVLHDETIEGNHENLAMYVVCGIVECVLA